MPRSIDTHKPDCTCPACRGRRGIATGDTNKLSVRLRSDVIEWLRGQPSAARAIEALVKGETMMSPEQWRQFLKDTGREGLTLGPPAPKEKYDVASNGPPLDESEWK